MQKKMGENAAEGVCYRSSWHTLGMREAQNTVVIAGQIENDQSINESDPILKLDRVRMIKASAGTEED